MADTPVNVNVVRTASGLQPVNPILMVDFYN